MGASPSGTLTLLLLIFIGPMIYAGNWVYVKFFKGGEGSMADPNHVAEKEGEREQLSSKQYLFALVGYAIGKYRTTKTTKDNNKRWDANHQKILTCLAYCSDCEF